MSDSGAEAPWKVWQQLAKKWKIVFLQSLRICKVFSQKMPPRSESEMSRHMTAQMIKKNCLAQKWTRYLRAKSTALTIRTQQVDRTRGWYGLVFSQCIAYHVIEVQSRKQNPRKIFFDFLKLYFSPFSNSCDNQLFVFYPWWLNLTKTRIELLSYHELRSSDLWQVWYHEQILKGVIKEFVKVSDLGDDS